MTPELFNKKAKEFGDFYMYFQKATGTTFAVATADLENDYIKRRLRGRKASDGEVLLWNWRYNAPLVVKYKDIKNLIPLSSVLANG